MVETAEIFEGMTTLTMQEMRDGTLDMQTWHSTSEPLLQDALAESADSLSAVATVTDRLTQVAEVVLSNLDYPPAAVEVHQLDELLTGKGISVEEATAAINGLFNSGHITEINGWWSRQVPELNNPITAMHR